MLSYSTRGTIVYIEWRQPLHVYTFFLLYIFKCSWNVVINKTRPVVIYWILTLGPWTIYHASLFWYDTNFYKVYWRALSLSLSDHSISHSRNHGHLHTSTWPRQPSPGPTLPPPPPKTKTVWQSPPLCQNRRLRVRSPQPL